jgi:hypothetical protein
MEQPRLASRTEMLAALTGRDRITPIEVTAHNVDQTRRAFHDDISIGNIVWTLPDTQLFGVIYAHHEKARPIRAILRHLDRSLFGVGDAVLLGEDSPFLRLHGSQTLVSLLNGR